MWKFHHNGRSVRDQNNNDLFYYEKNREGDYIKSPRNIWGDNKKHRGISFSIELLPIKSCVESWCLLYPSDRRDGIDLYVKKSILLDHL